MIVDVKRVVASFELESMSISLWIFALVMPSSPRIHFVTVGVCRGQRIVSELLYLLHVVTKERCFEVTLVHQRRIPDRIVVVHPPSRRMLIVE
jgi:hypothetical protein